jgi:predicted metal-dependent hydrolase
VALLLGGMRIDVLRKDIKNVHLSVHPPAGRIRIAAPRHLSDDAIRSFAIRKLGWIRRQQTKLLEQERETSRELLDRESHFVWGRRLLLRVVEADGAQRVDLSPRRLTLRIRPGTSASKRAQILEEWYRIQIRAALPPLLSRWAIAMRVTVRGVFVQRMKTKWGSANPRAKTIRLNTELARKPPECLEYLVVHELAHLLEPRHNSRFVALMDRLLPGWHSVRQTLNRLPVRHEDWEY